MGSALACCCPRDGPRNALKHASGRGMGVRCFFPILYDPSLTDDKITKTCWACRTDIKPAASNLVASSPRPFSGLAAGTLLFNGEASGACISQAGSLQSTRFSASPSAVPAGQAARYRAHWINRGQSQAAYQPIYRGDATECVLRTYPWLGYGT